MNWNFEYFIPTRIIFGAGKLKQLATEKLPGKKAFIVISSGKSMKANGYLDRTVAYLKENGVESVIFDKILPNPILDHVMEGSQLIRDNGCDFVVGLGGGSSIDSAKSIAIMATNPGDYWDYVGNGSGKGKPLENKALPIVAIPTTAGTGTESDPWTVITHTQTNEKIGFGVIPDTFPVFSIVDPELMLSVPPRLTAFQGIDAFCHSIEGYIANIAQPASDAFALSSISLIAENLPAVVADGSSIEGRSAIAWASTQAGLVESTSSCISEHSIEHALSAYHHELPHGAGLTCLLIPYHTVMIEKWPDKRYIDMAKAMGYPAEKPQDFIEALKKLIKDCGLEKLSLKDYGMDKSEAESIADNAYYAMGPLFELDPAKLEKSDVIRIVEMCFE